MGDRFSIRNGLQEFANQNDCRKSTRMRLWQVFAKRHVITYTQKKVVYDIVEDILSYFEQPYEMNTNPLDHSKNINKLQKFITEQCKWFEVYDFVEYYLQTLKPNNLYEIAVDIFTADIFNTGNKSKYLEVVHDFNSILEDESTGLHIINGIVVPITSKLEISEIETALSTCPKHVVTSVEKAIRLFSSRVSPDYNNAIKEMITAVEALCCTIVAEQDFTENTLGKAISKFDDCNVHLHEKLISAIKDLYKYTCNEDGIRHGGTSYTDEDVADARFMMVTCSAILNLLMFKWQKAKENPNV